LNPGAGPALEEVVSPEQLKMKIRLKLGDGCSCRSFSENEAYPCQTVFCAESYSFRSHLSRADACALAYNRSVDEIVSDPQGSQPYEVYKANFRRLMDLAQTQHSPIADIVNRVHQAAEHGCAVVPKLTKTISAAREGPYDSVAFLAEANALSAELAEANLEAAKLVDLLNTSRFLGRWMLVMLVTFAEAYLQDVLSLLVSDRLQRCSLPPAVGNDMTRKWLKDVLRSGSPHKWVKQMEKFGATEYSHDLANRMKKIWDRRHQIAHSAQPEIDNTAMQEFINASMVVNEFVETTDRFVVKSRPDAAQ